MYADTLSYKCSSHTGSDLSLQDGETPFLRSARIMRHLRAATDSKNPGKINEKCRSRMINLSSRSRIINEIGRSRMINEIGRSRMMDPIYPGILRFVSSIETI